jgi:tRNA nucleotidyltransferase/poly(A) polymerase
MKIFLVGGAVRDKVMGLKPNDFDYSVVVEDTDLTFSAGPFETMVANLELQGFRIFLKTPEHLTVRARFPKGHKDEKLTADFVLARKEGEYTDGRRPDSVEPGTLDDDLNRRDFTMNAIAEDEDGNFIDPHKGRLHINFEIIVAVGDPKVRMMEDSLRVLRALRFHVTLGFEIEDRLREVMRDPEVIDALKNVSDERKEAELNKMFKHDTLKTLQALETFHDIRDAIFAGKVNLLATMKTKGFK